MSESITFIKLDEAPSQQFPLGDWIVRLNYSPAVNRWSVSVFSIDGAPLMGGWFLRTGVNFLANFGGDLVLVDTVSNPSQDWYKRLTDGETPQSILIFGGKP